MVIFILVRRRFKYLATVTDVFGTGSELERGKPLSCLKSPSLLVLASRPPVQVQKSRGPFQHPCKQQVQTGAETNQYFLIILEKSVTILELKSKSEQQDPHPLPME
ncbi:unnamed protein product [Ixodes pacificus]